MSTTSRGLCYTCGYNLTGTPSQKCPECGAPFDPNNPKSMHMGIHPISKFERRFLKPLVRRAPISAAVATALLLLATGLPSTSNFSLLSLRCFPFFLEDALHHHTGYLTLAYLLSIVIWALLLAIVPVYLTLRAMVLFYHRIPRQFQNRAPRRVPIFAALFLIALILEGFGWPNRLATLIVSDQLAANPSAWDPLVSRREPYTIQLTQMLDPEDRIPIETYAASHLWFAKRRLAALAMLNYNDRAAAPAILRELLKSESDPTVRLAEFHLLLIDQDPAVLPLALELLKSANPQERIQGLDAISILRDYYRATRGATALDTNPPIPLGSIFTAAPSTIDPADYTRKYEAFQNQILTSPGLRDRILQLVRTPASDLEHEAALRALVTLPPEKSDLRYAEWGVWLATPESRKLIPKVLGEIPPCVLRVGDTVASMKSRMFQNEPMMITKPIIHFTTSTPMAIDLDIKFRFGRPAFVYPMPDDFSFTAPMPQCWGPPVPASAFNLAAMDPPPGTPFLPNLHSGLPWLTPHQETHDAWPNDPAEIQAWGLHWQNLFITPTLEPNQQLPDIPNDPKFLWWKKLRNVPSSYITNRGQSERFLYYDGPSGCHLPFDIKLQNNALAFTRQQRRFTAESQTSIGNPNSSHQAIYIDVQKTAAAATLSIIPSTAANLPLPPLTQNAPDQLLKTLTAAGLTTEEAHGLLQCWQSDFFQTPGRRLLLFLTPEEYDAFCPLNISPSPTHKTRVGIILYEFP